MLGNNPDTTFLVTASQLRESVKIFKERDYLLEENTMLLNGIALQKKLIYEYDQIVYRQKDQINYLNHIIIKKDDMINNNCITIDLLKKQIQKEQKEKKKFFLYGVGTGIVIVGIVSLLI